MSRNYPLISCICVTKNNPVLLRRSVECFDAQTYPNKELILLYEDNNRLIVPYIANALSQRKDIKIREKRYDDNRKLGHLRNEAIKLAEGEYICQWDDDDWHHAGRLEYQFSVIFASGYAGCILTNWLVYDSVRSNAYISNYRLWEGSLICRREFFLNREYDNIVCGEDTPLVNLLYAGKHLYLIHDAPNLYIYIYHGQNVWNAEHWDHIFRSGKALSRTVSTKIGKILSANTDAIDASVRLDKLLNNPIFEENE